MRCECAMSSELPAGNALNGERVINVSLQFISFYTTS